MTLDDLVLVLAAAEQGDLTLLEELPPSRATLIDDALRRAGLYNADLN